MVKMASVMLPLGTHAPEFSLTNVVNDETVSLKQHQGKSGTLIMFICNHCPFVKHIRTELARLANDYQPKGFSIIAINANDATRYPDDSPENMRLTAKEYGYTFPYLFDLTQDVAKAYQAACTPDFFLFDKNLSLVYRGQLDDSRPGNDLPVDGKSLRHAMDCLAQDEPIPAEQKPSLGCSIKWKE